MTLIKSLLIFYPLIIPVWQQEPFDHNNIIPPERRSFLASPLLKFQFESFRRIKDPNIRRKMVLEWIKAHNPEVASGLTSCYQTEKDLMVKINILTALNNIKEYAKTDNIAMLKECSTDKNEMIRGLGMVLYLDKTNDPALVLNSLEKEDSLYVKNLLWDELKSYYENCKEGQLEKLLQADDAVNRAGATRILAMKTTEPDSNAALKKIADDKEIGVRALLTEGLASRVSGGSQLLAKMSKDPAVQVRTFAASAKAAPKRVQMHIALSTDSDSEVRRLAVLALRNYREPAAINALLNAMNDSYKPVRTAAEDSIIAMKPAAEVMDRIGNEYLSQKPAAHSAVRVLGELKYQRFNEKILNILNTTTDTDMIIRTVNALSKLDYKKAATSIAKKATHEDSAVKVAVGGALGFLNVKETFDTLVTLSDDIDNPTSKSAIKAMGITKDPYFIDCLMKVAKDVQIIADRRSFAYWSLARINKPSNPLVKLLKRNIMEKIIPVPQSPPEYDRDFARIGAVLALVEMGKTDSNAKNTVKACIAELRTPTEEQGMEYISSKLLQEYARQADLYMQGKNIEKVPLSTRSTFLSVKECKPKRK